MDKTRIPAQRIRTAHRARGRIRLSAHHARGNAHALNHIKQAIAPMPGVRRVDANPVTGSVVVHYDPALYGKFQGELKARGETTGAFHLELPTIGQGGELMRDVQEEAEFLAGHSETARVIVDIFKRLNRTVRRATGNAVDLKVLLPLGLAAYSAVEIGIEASTPLWVTLGIFSFNSFVTLHSSPEPTPPSEEASPAVIARPGRTADPQTPENGHSR